ncbi:MAG: ferritin [Lentisphaeria bacterium]
MISAKMTKAINQQINAELYSSYLYLAMSAWAQSQNLAGFAKWLDFQAKEENSHAMKFLHYLFDQGANVTLEAIAKPTAKWANARGMFKNVLEHERKVTALIHGLAELAAAEHDFATGNLLQWFVNEQIEEEANAGLIVAKMEMLGDSKTGLLMIDKELGKRGG